MEEEITERDEAIGKGIIKQIQRLIFPAIWIYNGATHTHTHTHTQLLAMVLYTFSPS
jgi:hypothetical protein